MNLTGDGQVEPGDEESGDGIADPIDEASLDRAVELFENGRILYEEGQYREAIVAWEESFRLSEKPGLLYNMASAHERLGEYSEAIEMIARYRAFAPSEERESLDRRVRNLRLLEEERAREATPAPSAPEVAEAPVVEPSGSGRRIVGGLLLGAGAVNLGLSSTFGVLSLSSGQRAESLCVSGGPCPAAARDDLALQDRQAVASNITLGASAVLAGAGIGVLLTGPRERAPAVALGLSTDRVYLTFSDAGWTR